MCVNLALPTETKVESETSQITSGTSVNLSNSGFPQAFVEIQRPVGHAALMFPDAWLPPIIRVELAQVSARLTAHITTQVTDYYKNYYTIGPF